MPNDKLLEQLRLEISRRREELTVLENAYDVLSTEPRPAILNGARRKSKIDLEPTPAAMAMLEQADAPPPAEPKTLRGRVLAYLESKGPVASVSTDELAAALDTDLDRSFKVNLNAMARAGMIERLPLPDTWRMKT